MHNSNKWHNLFNPPFTALQQLDNFNGVKISIKRDDLNHKVVQGNKLRKLKYNIKAALERDNIILATFGGAWSNHISATAKASDYCGLKSIGFIRGDELENQQHKWNKTLNQAAENNMRLIFLNRHEYRQKLNSDTVKKTLTGSLKNAFCIPEGGSNSLALLGVAEIIDELSQQTNAPDYIITACGTGGTMAGLIDGVAKHKWHTKVIGICVLKGADYINDEIKKLSRFHSQVDWCIATDYHAGGYAKINNETVLFAQQFNQKYAIKLDKIYTAKAFYGAYDLVKKGEIQKNSHAVVLHTGGLQGGIIL